MIFLAKKSKQGIVGKHPDLDSEKINVGEGIDFVAEGITSGPQLHKEMRKRRNDK